MIAQPWRGAVATLALAATFTINGAAAGAGTSPAASSPPMAAASASPSPPTPSSISPAPIASTPRAPDPSTGLPQVEIESKFIEISKPGALTLGKSGVLHEISAWYTAQSSVAPGGIFRSSLVLPADFSLLVRQLNQCKGVDLLSAPRVTTKSGQKATVEITREFIYPTAYERGQDSAGRPLATPTRLDKADTGVSLDVNPTVASKRDVIDLSIGWKITNFDGFVDDDGKPVSAKDVGAGAKYPVFTTRSVDTVASLAPGATVVFSMDGRYMDVRQDLPPQPGQKKDEAVAKKANDERLLLISVTARLVETPPAPPVLDKGTGDHPATPGTSVTKQDGPSSLPADSSAPSPSP